MKKLYSIGLDDENKDEVYVGLIEAITLYGGKIVNTNNVAGIDLVFFIARKRSFKKIKKLLAKAGRNLSNLQGHWIITS